MPQSYDAIIVGGGHNGLVCAAYLAKAGKELGWPIKPELVVGVSIPIVAITLTAGVRYLRKVIAKGQQVG